MLVFFLIFFCSRLTQVLQGTLEGVFGADTRGATFKNIRLQVRLKCFNVDSSAGEVGVELTFAPLDKRRSKGQSTGTTRRLWGRDARPLTSVG